MRIFAIAAAATALLTAGTVSAHQTGSMMQQGRPDADTMRPYSGMGPGMMMGGGFMGHGMTHMMTIMMDTDGDGTLSLEEFQAVQLRAFRAMDLDGDGKLTPEEMDRFMGAGPSDGDE